MCACAPRHGTGNGLARRFTALGGGMQLRRGVVTQLWELER